MGTPRATLARARSAFAMKGIPSVNSKNTPAPASDSDILTLGITPEAPAPEAPAPETESTFDANALLAMGSVDPRAVAFGRDALAAAESGGKLTLTQWPVFPKGDAKAKATHAEPMYEGDANRLRHILSLAARSAGVEIGSAPGQFRIDVRKGNNIVTYIDPLTGAASDEYVLDSLSITYVTRAAKTRATINRSARF